MYKRQLHKFADLLIYLLGAAALLGLAERTEGPLRWNPRDQVINPRSQRDEENGGQPAIAADGELVARGDRVQTQWRREEGGNGEWFAGTIAWLQPSRDGGMIARIEYDDGEAWTGNLRYVYVLRGEQEDEEAAAASPLPVATAVPVGGGGDGGEASAVATAVPVGADGGEAAWYAVGRRVS